MAARDRLGGLSEATRAAVVILGAGLRPRLRRDGGRGPIRGRGGRARRHPGVRREPRHRRLAPVHEGGRARGARRLRREQGRSRRCGPHDGAASSRAVSDSAMPAALRRPGLEAPGDPRLGARRHGDRRSSSRRSMRTAARSTRRARSPSGAGAAARAGSSTASSAATGASGSSAAAGARPCARGSPSAARRRPSRCSPRSGARSRTPCASPSSRALDGRAHPRPAVRRGARGLLAGDVVARRRAGARRGGDRRAVSAAQGAATDHAARRHARGPDLARGDAAPRRRAEWDCDCAGRDDACEHVAAAVIALRRAREQGRDLRVNDAGRIGYRLTRAGSGLALERVVVTAAGEVPLLTSLVSIASGRVEGPSFVATPGRSRGRARARHEAARDALARRAARCCWRRSRSAPTSRSTALR